MRPGYRVSRRTRLALVGCAAALTAGLIISLTIGLVVPRAQARRAPHAARFVDRAYGWSIRYPAGMIVGHFHSGARYVADGVRITTFAPDLSQPNGSAPATSWLRTFPADGMAVEIWTLIGSPTAWWFPLVSSTQLPLRPASFGRVRPYAGGSEPAPEYRSITADGSVFSVAVWVGSRASHARMAEAWAIVRSLAFPALRPGGIWQGTYYVLGEASRYPVGSITPFPAAALPAMRGHRHGFYLLRYPRGFYAIDEVFHAPVRPYASCTVGYDASAGQFRCRGTDLRWDRNGLPVGAHSRAGPAWALPLGPATVSADGHVLVNPFFGQLPAAYLPAARQR
jgi:hypothetical protein